MAFDLSAIQDIVRSLSFSEALPVLKLLVFYVVGITIYSVFIFKFYKFIARKDIFELNLQQYGERKISNFFLYVLEYLIIFPLITAFWFVILFLLLVFLTKNQEITSVLLTSMAIIAIVRVTSYYNEELSKDLAKMLPFTLLGIFLIDASYFSVSSSIDLLNQAPLYIKDFIYYFLFVVIVEFVSRICYSIYAYASGKDSQEN